MNFLKALVFLLIIPFGSVYGQHQNIMVSDSFAPNEPAIVINPKNTAQIMAGANLANLYISSDTGNTWTKTRLTCSHGVWGDPILIVDTTGQFYYFHLSNNIAVSGTWIDRIICQPVDMLGNWTDGSYTGLNGSKKQDKETAVVDRKTNRMYVTWTQFDNYGSPNIQDSTVILFSASANQGNTWTAPVRLNAVAGDCVDSSNTIEGAVPCVGPNGEIYVAWTGGQGIMFDRSTDGGQTWLTNDISVDNMATDWAYDVPGLFRCNGLPFIACDLSNGTHHGDIYLSWTDQRNGANNTDVWLRKSNDGGNTWGNPVKVNNDIGSTHQFMSSMTIDQVTGYIYVLYYDRRAYADNRTDVYIAVSRDGGQIFFNDKISDAPFVPFSNTFFGDYTNITAHNNIIRPIWGRTDTAAQSIWTAKIDTSLIFTSVPNFPGLTVDNDVVYPNPFFGTTCMSFKLFATTPVTLYVTDVYGRKIATLKNNESLNAGKHIVRFNADDYGLAAGIYYFHLSAGNILKTQKIILAK